MKSPYLRWLMLLLLATALRAQNILHVKVDGIPYLVQGARGGLPLVERYGKLTAVDSQSYVLSKFSHYLPYLVEVNDFRATNYSAGDMNFELEVRCNLTTAHYLEEVFMVLFVHGETQEKGLFLYEIGTLRPGVSEPVFVKVPITQNLTYGLWRYEVLLFSKGAQLLTSSAEKADLESAFEQRVAEKVGDKTQAPAQPLTGPQPQYPKELYKQRVPGKAVVSFQVTKEGFVSEPVLNEATHPEFGKAALRAIRYWRFAPKVKEGQRIASKVRMPFTFTPPATEPEN